jgi:phosphoenolpyruvate carboxylase
MSVAVLLSRIAMFAQRTKLGKDVYQTPVSPKPTSNAFAKTLNPLISLHLAQEARSEID